jgi:uncharacterized protein
MKKDEAEKLLKKYYSENTTAFKYLYIHSQAVANCAVQIAKRNKNLNPDVNFIQTAAILHDIAIFLTHAPGIGCYGKFPYIAHGYLGKRLLEYEGYPEHALVCERHVGVGITAEDVIKNKLPLPQHDMIPLSIEEQIVCYADKFYSKKPGRLSVPKDADKIIRNLEVYGDDKPEVFKGFIMKFGII